MGNDLQAIARHYLMRLRYMARKHGLLPWLDDVIKANKDERCAATENEVRMLSRLCDDSNVKRADVPKILGKSYRACVDDMDFERIRQTKSNRGIYDKVSALLLAGKEKKKEKKRK